MLELSLASLFTIVEMSRLELSLTVVEMSRLESSLTVVEIGVRALSPS